MGTACTHFVNLLIYMDEDKTALVAKEVTLDINLEFWRALNLIDKPLVVSNNKKNLKTNWPLSNSNKTQF